MSARKRSFDLVMDGCGAASGVAVDDQQQQRRGAAKRCGHLGVGELQFAEVQRFLERLSLSRHMPACPAALEQATGLSAAGWQAMAELHLLCEARFSSVSSDMLKQYHCFCRKPRAELWHCLLAHHERQLQQQQHHHQQHQQGLQAGLPVALQLVRFLLEAVLSPYPTASLVKYTMLLPPWLVSWAARWGWSSPTITVLILEAFAPAGGADGAGASGQRRQQAPAAKLFVPVLPA